MTQLARMEELLKAQDRVRSAYRRGDIDAALAEFDKTIRPALGSVDQRISRLAKRLAKSFLWMADDDLAKSRRGGDNG